MAKKAATKPKGGATNGKQPSKPTPMMSIHHQHVMVVGIALLAFAVGILCPPILSHFQGSALLNHDGSRRSTMQSSSNTAEHSVSFTNTRRPPKYPCTEERLAEYVHDENVAGFHIVCLEYDANRTLQFDIYVGGSNKVHHEMTGTSITWDSFREILEGGTGMSSSLRDFQPWALFSPDGERLFDGRTIDAPTSKGTIVDTLTTDYGMVLVYSGGQFLWPGVRLGFKREVSLYSIMPGDTPKTFEKNQTATLETLSLFPLVLSVEGFLSKDECRHIQVR